MTAYAVVPLMCGKLHRCVSWSKFDGTSHVSHYRLRYLISERLADVSLTGMRRRSVLKAAAIVTLVGAVTLLMISPWLLLKTVLMTIGAAIVYANSPWYSPRQRPYDFSQLQSAVLKKLDNSGQLVKATELWREHGAVINVIRRVG